MILALAAAAALTAGYQLGRHDAYNRAFGATQDWADRRQGRAARWAVQPVYALLIAVGFAVHPIRWTSNYRANRAYRARRQIELQYQPKWNFTSKQEKQ